MGNPAYVPRYDLDGDGRLTAADVFRVLEHLWERVPAA